MYLAPLNYDRYFKKVFSDTAISKRFLEDFFEVEIQEIELMQTKHKITDDSTAVEFDFRCKINNNYVIIDMQQWFKPDVVKRFYMYHSMNTVLQLEKMPDKSVSLSQQTKRSTKDYNSIIPVITLIWMVDDNLGFNDDFVSYTMTPETIIDFIKNKQIWESEATKEALLQEHKRCLTLLNNKTKNIDFLQTNRLIYAFQKNIVQNQTFKKYHNWFTLAEKTLNKLNTKDWFNPYLKDAVFVEIVKRLNKETLVSEDISYIDDYEKFREEVKRYEDAIYINAKEEGIEIGREAGREEGITQERQIQQQNQLQEKLLMAKTLKANKVEENIISLSTGFTKEQIEQL